MRLLIPLSELDNYACRALIPLECEDCGAEFSKPKNRVLRAVKGTRPIGTCSVACSAKRKRAPLVLVTCSHCGKPFSRPDVFKAASHCSRSCASAASRTPEMRATFMKNRQVGGNSRASIETVIKYIKCKGCDKTFVAKHSSTRTCCSTICRSKRASDRCKTIPGMCKNNNRHAGWYESPIAGRVWLESSWEVKCSQILDKHQIPWRRPKETFEWIDAEGKSHRYHPDFYLIDKDLYLDPKNPYRQQIDAYKIADVRKRHPIKLLILSKKDIEETRFLSLIS